MRDLIEALEAWRREGVDAGRAVVVRTFGSAPRPEGAVLLRADDGRLIGSVSGGCIEGAATEQIAEARGTGLAKVIRYGISDRQAWDVGLACGGTIDVLIQPRVSSAALNGAARPAAQSGGATAVITPLPPDSPPSTAGPHATGSGAEPEPELIVGAGGEIVAGSTGSPELDNLLASTASGFLREGRSQVVEVEGRAYFVEVYPVRPRLVVVGAVEVARPLIRYARDLGYETVVVDGRSAFATRERFPEAHRIEVAWPEDAFEAISVGQDDAVAILSHDPKFDEPAILEAVRRGCRYVGAVGSRATQVARRERLADAGLTSEEIDSVRGPIGLDLGGRDPAETALAIMAEIVALRHGGSGVPMKDRPRSTASMKPDAPG
ncbi:MAG: XdhC/CoxI family protein [Chloroflexota bacterium]